MTDNLPAPSTKDTELAVRQAFAQGTPMQQLFGAVFEELGGTDFMVEWAEDNPSQFMSLFMAANPNPVASSGSGSGPALHVHLPEGLAPGPLDTPVSEQ